MTKYADYIKALNAKRLSKLKKFIEEKNITKEAMVLFLNKENEKVSTKESLNTIIKRINEFDFSYVQGILPNLKAKLKTLKPKKHFRAYLGAHQTFEIKPLKKHLFSFPKFFQDAKTELNQFLNEMLVAMKGITVKLSYLGNFYLPTDEEFTLHEKNFRSEMHEIINDTKIATSVDHSILMNSKMPLMNLCAISRDGYFILTSKFM